MSKLHTLLITLLVLAASCGTLRKNKSSHRQEVKTEQQVSKDVNGTFQKDSAVATYNHTTDSIDTQIEFEQVSGPLDGSGDTTEPKKAPGQSRAYNSVKVHPDGTIEATGAIKSAKTTRKQTAVVGDSSRVKESTTEQTRETVNSKTAEKTEVKTKEVKRSTPWYLYALVLLIVIGIGLYIDYRTGGHVLWWLIGLFRRRKSSNDRAG